MRLPLLFLSEGRWEERNILNAQISKKSLRFAWTDAL